MIITENNNKQDDTVATPPKNGKRNKITGYVILIFLVIGLLSYGIWWFFFRDHEATPDAYVGGNMIVLTARQEGSVIAYYVDDTDYVEEGQLLVQLDPTDFLLFFEENKAALELAVREVRDQAEAVKQHSANVALKEALLARAEFDFHNRKFLVESEAVSQEDFYHSKTDYSAAQASLDLSIHQLEAAKITLGDTDLENHPLIERAKSELREAFLGLKRCSIFSPASGYIAKRSVQVGQSIQPTTPLLSVIPLNDIWVDANYKETQLRNIRIGQSVEVFADMYGNDVTFHGTVGGIQGGSGSVFSLLPPQNATGNWIKIVQRVPVRIYLDPKEIKEHPLFLGLSVYTKVDVGDTNGPMLGTRTVSKPLMKTDVFDVSFAEIDAVINEIVRSNFGIEK